MTSPTDKRRRVTKPVRMTRAQREWCLNYKKATTFEPLMDDFLAGNCTFVEAAKRSNVWFDDWSSDAYLSISRQIPGEYE